MSEKIPQSNPENSERKTYLIPRPDGGFDEGCVTGKKEEYRLVLQRDGSTETMKWIEVQLPDRIGPNGESTPRTEMIAEHLLSDSVQVDFMQQQQDISTNNEKEQYE